MKKLISLLLIFLIPIQIFACPHFDEDGNLYLLYYDSLDYNITIVEYPKNQYHQLYYFDEYDIQIKEEFEIPLFASMQIDYEVDIFTPVSEEPYYIDIDRIDVASEKFELSILLEDSIEKLIPNVDETTTRLSYFISTKLINDNVHDNIKNRLDDYIKDLPVQDLELDILYLNAIYKKMDADWRTDEKIIRDFFDPVTVKYPINSEIDDLALIKIDSFYHPEINVQEIDFLIEENEENDYAVFLVDQASYYYFVQKDGEITTQTFANDEYEEPEIFEEEEEFNMLGIIILSGIGFVIFIGALIFISKKQIKVE